MNGSRAILDRLEWGCFIFTSTREGLGCPICSNFKREGHAEDCWLRKALVSLGEPEPELAKLDRALIGAHKELKELIAYAFQKGGHSFRISIPARPGFDSDLLISNGIRAGLRAVELLTEERKPPELLDPKKQSDG